MYVCVEIANGNASYQAKPFVWSRMASKRASARFQEKMLHILDAAVCNVVAQHANNIVRVLNTFYFVFFFFFASFNGNACEALFQL